MNTTSHFPATRLSVLEALGSADRETRSRALGVVAEGYWRPVCAYIAARWQVDQADAEDLTQSFFTRALLVPLLERYDASRARFRTYLRLCVDGHVRNARAAERRVRRGGDMTAVPLTGQEPEPEQIFEREWVRAVLADALRAMRLQFAAKRREIVYQVFVRYDVDGADAAVRPTYAELAAEFDVPVSQITNYLAAARKALRLAVLDRLRTLTATQEELRRETAALLGV
jgi:RNA polymerase sigma factor (sigma-70 family)